MDIISAVASRFADSSGLDEKIPYNIGMLPVMDFGIECYHDPCVSSRVLEGVTYPAWDGEPDCLILGD